MTEILVAIIAFCIGYAAHWLASRDERETLKLLVNQQHDATMQRLGYRKPQKEIARTAEPSTKENPSDDTLSPEEQAENMVKDKLGSLKPPDLFGLRQSAIENERKREQNRRQLVR
jgi:hypothetical protein